MANALRDYYRKKSTEELQQLLDADIYLDGEDELGPDAVDAILDVLQERKANKPREYPDAVAAWETFCQEQLPYVEVNREPAEDTDNICKSTYRSRNNFDERQIRIRKILRVAGITVAALLLFSIISVTAYAAGYDIWGAVATWTADTFSFARTRG